MGGWAVMVSEMNHEAYKEMLVSESLDLPVDAGDQDDAAEFRLHLASCANCQAELQSLRETAAQLAHIATPVPASAQVRATLLREIKSFASDATSSAHTSSLATEKSNVIVFRRRTFVFGAMAAGLLLAVTLITSVMLWRRLDRTDERLARAEKAEAMLASPDTRIAILRGTPEAPSARARLIVNRRTGETVLYSFDLPPARAGQAYQLWYIADGRPLPGAVFTTDPQGHATLKQQAPSNGAAADAFAVTIEPAAGSATPTGEKYLITPTA